MLFCPIASGSKGNCFYVEGGGARVLVDAGLTAKEITRRLASIDVMPNMLDAILVTHEHIDHVSAVPLLSRRHKLDVIGSEGTLKAPSRVGKLLENAFRARELSSGETMSIAGMRITSFSVPHDAAAPVGYRFSADGITLTVASDLGTVTRLIRASFEGSDAMIIESNHDPEMLLRGPYSWELKQRIRSKHGHLSNIECSEFLAQVNHPGLQHVVLAHLSEVNNMPHLAFESAQSVFASQQNACGLTVAPQHEVGTFVTLFNGGGG